MEKLKGKKIAKVLSALLVVAILLSCVAINSLVSAETKYDYYLAIGSSITRGFDCDNYYDCDKACNMQIPEAYPCRVAETIGIPTTNRYSCSYGALTTGATLVLFGEQADFDYADKDLIWEEYLQDMLQRFAVDSQRTALLEQYKSLVDQKKYPLTKQRTPIDEILAKDKLLVTLEYGLADTIYRGGWLADFSEIDLNDTKSVTEFLKTITSETEIGYQNLCTNLPKIIDYILEKNPNTTITLMGMFNPIANLSLTADDALPIGSIVTPLVEKVNKEYRALAAKYAQVVYVDVYNVDTPATEADIAMTDADYFFAGGGKNTHPSKDGGLRYMAYQVESALGLHPKANANDVVVHMGCVKNVVGVTVNGLILKKFTFKDSVLTVNNKTKLGDTMTVFTKDENGTVGLYCYDLSYDKTNGYTVHREYSTNDLAKTATKSFNPLKKAGETIKSKLTEWFK